MKAVRVIKNICLGLAVLGLILEVILPPPMWFIAACGAIVLGIASGIMEQYLGPR